MEKWKTIPEFPKYEASTLGRVRNKKTSLIRKMRVTRHGYCAVTLNGDSKRQTVRIHQLVAIAWLGHVRSGMKVVVDHIDNNPLNNAVSNLQLVTTRENSTKDKKGPLPTGVGRQTGSGYKAKIKIDGKFVYLGSYTTAQEAGEAYEKKLKEISS